MSRRQPRSYAHIGEGPIYEAPHPNKGPVQHGTGRAGRPYIAAFNGQNGESCRLKLISQLMRKISEPFVKCLDALVFQQRTALERILSDGIGNTVIKTAVERSKLVYLDQ